MKINLTAIFDHPSAITNKTRYARVDNNSSPVFIPGPNAISSPTTISPVGGVDNGQYRIGITPVYADQRKCSETFYDTPSCPIITSFNAIIEGSNIIVSYSAAGELPKVRLSINYPNGGSFSGIYTNGANNSTITVPLPTGLSGNVSVYLQSVCDEETGFFGPLPQPIVIDYQSSIVANAILDVLCEVYAGPNPTEPGTGQIRSLRYHKLKFTLAQALNAPLELDLAFTVMTPTDSLIYPGYTNGYDILPNGTYEKSLTGLGYNLPYRITIPAGTTQFTTNSLEFASSAQPPYTEVIPCRDNVNNYPYVSEKIFARVVNNVNNITISVNSITNSNNYPTTFQQVP
jgi:hypothetical protein